MPQTKDQIADRLVLETIREMVRTGQAPETVPQLVNSVQLMAKLARQTITNKNITDALLRNKVSLVKSIVQGGLVSVWDYDIDPEDWTWPGGAFRTAGRYGGFGTPGEFLSSRAEAEAQQRAEAEVEARRIEDARRAAGILQQYPRGVTPRPVQGRTARGSR